MEHLQMVVHRVYKAVINANWNIIRKQGRFDGGWMISDLASVDIQLDAAIV